MRWAAPPLPKPPPPPPPPPQVQADSAPLSVAPLATPPPPPRVPCARTAAKIDRLLAVLARRAEGTVEVVMPGYTHLQRAQPVRLAHHLLAWCEMLERDRGRLDDAARRMNESPLGSAALAGTTFPLDREQTARALGFERPMRNSLDAVSDRDFLLEALSALSICAVHLSRIGEELVLWSAQEFGSSCLQCRQGKKQLNLLHGPHQG